VITIPGESFQKEGNLAKKDGALGFLYEEPGKPAIFVKLVFVADAMCGNGSATSSCAIMGSAGDRVTVEGRKDKDTVFVSKLTVITR
jgi:hypothetical protein